MKTLIRNLAVLFGAAALTTAPALAAEGEAHAPEAHEWTWDGPLGRFDRAQLQRGFQVYQEVCASCHALEQISFRNLAEGEGPFTCFPDPDAHEEDGHHAEPICYDNPNDNPIILQLASGYQVEDGPDDAGDMFERPGIPADPFPAPFANEQQARASNGGAYPPDLSLIVKARGGGANYVRSLLLGYHEAPAGTDVRPGLHYNEYFPGGQIAMAPPLMDGLVTYADDTEATTEQMAEDVVAFLAWASDPHRVERNRLGLMVMIYFLIFAVLLWFAYKQVWSRVEH
ncbi:MAG: cytochrome c1 [Maricaulis sp.]|jgi:cytochrome c1|nr:cytochrome c1 [Maricaulis sp.]HAQ35330.1 cytochrome c1 [Alphaproteobacteria bacterium]